VVGVICQLVSVLHLVIKRVGMVILDPPVPPHLLILGIWSFSQVLLVTFWVTPRMSRIGKLVEENGGGSVGLCGAWLVECLILLQWRPPWELAKS